MPEVRSVRCRTCHWRGRRVASRFTEQSCPKCGGSVSKFYRKRRGSLKERLQAQDRLVAAEPVEKPIRTKLEGGLIDAICDVIRSGNFAGTSALSFGVPRSTFSTWMTRGRYDQDQGDQTVFAELHQRVEKARAEGEVVLVKMGLGLVEKGGSTWMGAYRHLESYARERWNRSVEVNVNAYKAEYPIDVPPEPPQTHQEWLQRRAERSNQVEKLGAVETENEICDETNSSSKRMTTLSGR